MLQRNCSVRAGNSILVRKRFHYAWFGNLKMVWKFQLVCNLADWWLESWWMLGFHHPCSERFALIAQLSRHNSRCWFLPLIYYSGWDHGIWRTATNCMVQTVSKDPLLKLCALCPTFKGEGKWLPEKGLLQWWCVEWSSLCCSLST